ncbi:MAG: sulfatase-like hydrolase/transferase [Planctomycetaceae bacterium]|jgi:uncharacterized sulfatase|nr:sulfatase-like hydrolase/transferase [Planctomycetaceae bacterium]
MKQLKQLISLFFFLLTALPVFAAEERPNILWLTCEDTGRHLGSYNFPTAQTPVLDKLAAEGQRFVNAWSNYPVCAPARTTLITGCYPASLGAEQMRSSVPLPKTLKMYPYYLRQAGYYSTNNAKTDYNVFNQDDRRDQSCWDECNNQAHWKNRPDGKPFFAVFNFTVTHESQIRNPHQLQRDPDKTPVPKYHPNVPEVRRDWAQYHDRITEMDAMCGRKLDELREAGLTDSTIIFFYGDHGSGMPRNKRTPFDCGLGVPLVVYFPPKFQHLAPAGYKKNGISEQLVSFVDFAPTLLSIAGVKPPEDMQGIPFAGKYAGKPREYVFGFRGRMDERADLVRSVRDKRYVYVRNYHPEIIYGSPNNYMFQTRTTQVWRELYDAGKLPPEQSFFWKLKPTEELYDLQTDPDEIKNLAYLPEHQDVKNRLKTELKQHLLEIRDVHFLPENILHQRFGDSTPWEYGHSKDYNLEKILNAADAATERSTPDNVLKQFLADNDAAVRYWGTIGVLLRLADTAGTDGTKPTERTTALFNEWKPELVKRIDDDEPAVQVAAAEILGRYGSQDDVEPAVKKIFLNLQSDSPYTAWLALEAFDRFAERGGVSADTLAKTVRPEIFTGRIQTLYPKLIEHINNQRDESRR